jgi:hypothetical protein
MSCEQMSCSFFLEEPDVLFSFLTGTSVLRLPFKSYNLLAASLYWRQHSCIFCLLGKIVLQLLCTAYYCFAPPL